MNRKTLWDQRLGMLMACGSPGSALAYHLGQTTLEPEMVRRNKATLESLPPSPPEAAQSDSHPWSFTSWIQRGCARLEAWAWQRELRRREAYLAQASDLADLEARMREMDREVFTSHGRALR